jgi:hypothetical protein
MLRSAAGREVKGVGLVNYNHQQRQEEERQICYSPAKFNLEMNNAS